MSESELRSLGLFEIFELLEVLGLLGPGELPLLFLSLLLIPMLLLLLILLAMLLLVLDELGSEVCRASRPA
jgi:hypothetical protein